MPRLQAQMVIDDDEVARETAHRLTNSNAPTDVELRLARLLMMELLRSRKIRFDYNRDPITLRTRVNASIVVGEERKITYEMPEVKWQP